MFKIDSGTEITYRYTNIESTLFTGTVEWENDTGYTVRTGNGDLAEIPYECIDLVRPEKMYVVSWISAGKAKAQTFFSFDAANKKANRMLDRGAQVWMDEKSAGIWVPFH